MVLGVDGSLWIWIDMNIYMWLTINKLQSTSYYYSADLNQYQRTYSAVHHQSSDIIGTIVVL